MYWGDIEFVFHKYKMYYERHNLQKSIDATVCSNCDQRLKRYYLLQICHISENSSLSFNCIL